VRQQTSILLVGLGLMSLAGPARATDCTKDTDCPGELVCDDGQCVDPAPACESNSDCQGGQLCVQGVCVDMVAGGAVFLTEDEEERLDNRLDGVRVVCVLGGWATWMAPAGFLAASVLSGYDEDYRMMALGFALGGIGMLALGAPVMTASGTMIRRITDDLGLPQRQLALRTVGWVFTGVTLGLAAVGTIAIAVEPDWVSGSPGRRVVAATLPLTMLTTIPAAILLGLDVGKRRKHLIDHVRVVTPRFGSADRPAPGITLIPLVALSPDSATLGIAGRW